MKLQLIKKEKNQAVLHIQGVSPATINAIRRAVMKEVPVFAIEEVEFRKNSSPLYDEMLAHRLGLLSLATDLEHYNLPDACPCGGTGCAQCQVTFTLKAEGPCTVYAKDLKSNDPKVVPVHEKTPLVKLLEGQELELQATAILGRGKEHAKWNAALAYYKEVPHLSIKRQPANAKALAEKYPEITELKNGKLSIKEDALPFYDVHEALISEADGAISVTYKDDYYFFIESWEQLKPETILEQALKELNKQLDEVKKLAKAL